MNTKYHHSSTLLYVPSAKTNFSTDDEHSSIVDVPSTQYFRRVLTENDELRKEVKKLQSMLGIKRGVRTNTRLKSEGCEEDQEKKRFRKVIQKSYYSLKEMEKQIQRLKKTIQENTVSLQALQHEFRLVSAEKQALTVKLAETEDHHREEMKVSNEKILKLEVKMQNLVNTMQGWEIEWRKEKEELKQLKKFYLNRTL